jgi:hypothetical protein
MTKDRHSAPTLLSRNARPDDGQQLKNEHEKDNLNSDGPREPVFVLRV